MEIMEICSNVLMSALIGICLWYILYQILYWFLVTIISMLNSEACYDKQKRRIILEMAETDTTWKRVSKMLNLEKIEAEEKKKRIKNENKRRRLC